MFFVCFLTPIALPPNPILSYFSTCPYFMMSYFDPPPPKSLYTYKYILQDVYKISQFFQMFGRKIMYIFKKLILGFKIVWVKENTHCVNSSLKRSFWSKNNFLCVKKTQQNMGCPIFAELPTPLVRFCPILLDPPTPQKIGHH